MSVKKEANGRRSVQVEVEVPGTPEQVWQAIATGPGVGAWFVPTEVDGRIGGTVTSHFGGGMDSVATITEWDAPHRFTKEGSWGPNAPTVATEWIVEARGGGTCIVRVVHSLFAETDDWDDQLTGIESGWPSFFSILRLYLEHFAGQPSSQIQLLAMPAASGAWEKLAGALNLAGAAPGERRHAGGGAPPLSGIVESVNTAGNPHTLLRVDLPAPGAVFATACPAGEKAFVTVSFYLYGDTAAAVVARDQSAWTAWMTNLFPA
ncbi:MAG TPA: SRPBCC domain-containing protein [Bryobacteraceae bacterium]|nr:SRPBCC domain-containing protein [Bryobacteraceae bacterium]